MPRLKNDQFVLDRIEEDQIAHLENSAGQQLAIPTAWLPAGAHEGHVLDVAVVPANTGASSITLTGNEAATTARREEATALRASLEKGPEGDIEL